MIRNLNHDESRKILASNYIGNLSYIYRARPYVVPITYFFDADHNVIIGYSAEGHKVRAMRKNGSVSLGVSEVDSVNSWNSVLAQGTFIELSGSDAKAQLHIFIDSLPNKYDSMVGDRGIKVSGGQRQRLSIARAILKDAPILILDEATSALDSEVEVAIQGCLNRMMEGKTVLAIAHRLSTVIHADKIIVLEKGRIVETGTHDELLAENGLYAHMWQSQQRNDGPSLGRTAVN